VRFHSSWPGLSRPSTSLTSASPQVVDARDKRGHDDAVMRACPFQPFVPAQAGTQASLISHAALIWIPAFAGMNGNGE
jgi:hypothetical protein